MWGNEGLKFGAGRCPNQGHPCFCTGACLRTTDYPPATTWTGVGTGQILGKKPKVWKSKMITGEWRSKPWIVSNHPLGTKMFATWQAAMFYANIRLTMFNGRLNGIVTARSLMNVPVETSESTLTGI